MKKIYAILLFMLITTSSIAQIKVKEGSFRRIVNYVMDDKDEHMDGNYMPMALIKISTENINAEERNKLYFKGNRATDFHVEPKIGELYLYISAEAATVLEIKHPDYGKTMFTFPEPLCDFCAYELVVQYIPLAAGNDKEPQNTYFLISSDHEDAMIYIDDEFVNVKEASKLFPVGSTHTWRIECKMYHTETGTVTLNERTVIDKTLRPAFGYLNVSTTPEQGARVFIDNEYVGLSPIKSDRLASGQHKVRVVKDMFGTKEETFTVTDGQITEAEISMSSNFVNVTINTDFQSDIYVDEEFKAKGTWTGTLSEGLHLFEARKAGYKPSKKSLNLVKGETRTITLDNPMPITGSLDINSTPMRADIYIDGTHSGQTPNIISDIMQGEHTLLLKKDGYADLTKKIIIEEDKTLSVYENMQKKQMSDDNTQAKKRKKEKTATDVESKTFIMANFAYSTAPQTSLGLTFATAKKLGWFVSAMTGLSFDAMGAKVECDENGMIDGQPAFYNGQTSRSRLSVTAGVMYRLMKPVYLKLGLGYGSRALAWQDTDGQWVKNAAYSVGGLDMSAGVLLNIGKIACSVDAVSTNAQTLEVKVGLGISF